MFDQNSYFRNLYDSGVRNKLVSMSDSRELQYAIDKLQFGEYILKSYPNITSLAKYTKKINTLETEKGFLERDIDDLLEEKSRIVQEKISGEWENMDKLFQHNREIFSVIHETPPNPFLVYNDISSENSSNRKGCKSFGFAVTNLLFKSINLILRPRENSDDTLNSGLSNSENLERDPGT